MRPNNLILKNRGRPARTLGATVLLLSLLLVALPSGASAANALAVHVSPDRAHATSGGVVQFSATVLDENGTETAASITWTVIPPTLGTIDTDGLFTAGAGTGRAIIRASAESDGGAGAGHAVVDIGTEPPRHLVVVVGPAGAAVAPGGSKSFSAVVTDPVTGNEVDAGIEWVVVPERLGSIDASGLFTASDGSGSGRIAARASYAGRQGVGDAALVVGSTVPAGATVAVTPRSAGIAPGGTQRFDAVVADADGQPVDAQIEWTVMPHRLGVVDPDGLFVAGPDDGTGRLIASVATATGPARGIATIEVGHPGPAGVTVRIRPREAAVLPGDDVALEAVVLGPDGELLDVPVDWSVSPDWIGFIGSDGVFAASEEMPDPPQNGNWNGTVTASVETEDGVASDGARVIVRDIGPRLRLRIHPARPIVAPGQDVQFEDRVLGPGAPDDWTTEWTVLPADLGTVTPDGLFTANALFGDPTSGEFGPRDGAVIARATLPDGSILTDRAHVRVRTAGHPVRIRVSPAIAILEPGATAFFDATIIGPDGTALDLPVTWSARPQGIGAITPDGEFTATEHPGGQGGHGSGERLEGLVVAELRLPGGGVFRGAATVIVESENE